MLFDLFYPEGGKGGRGGKECQGLARSQWALYAFKGVNT